MLGLGTKWRVRNCEVRAQKCTQTNRTTARHVAEVKESDSLMLLTVQLSVWMVMQDLKFDVLQIAGWHVSSNP